MIGFTKAAIILVLPAPKEQRRRAGVAWLCFALNFLEVSWKFKIDNYNQLW